MTDNKANTNANAAALRVWVGCASSQTGKAAVTALLEYPNVMVTASARDTKGLAEHFKSAIEAKRLNLVAITSDGGVLRHIKGEGPAVPAPPHGGPALPAAIDMKGYDALLLSPPPALTGNRIAVAVAYSDAAKKGGVKHIVLYATTPKETVHLLFNSEMPAFVDLFKTVAGAGALTVLRTLRFYDNVFLQTFELKATGACSVPIDGDAKMSGLSVDDIGRAAARVAVDGGAKHGGKDYTLFAEDLSMNGMMRDLSKATGKTFGFRTVPGEAWGARLQSFGVPFAFASGLVGLYEFLGSVARDELKTGKHPFAHASGDLAALLAPRKPETFVEWLALPATRARLAPLTAPAPAPASAAAPAK